MYFPKEPGYDGKFFLQVLTGNKLVIQAHIILILVNPDRSHGGYGFRYYIKEKKFTKEDILNRLLAINNSRKYLPDDIKLSSLSRDFLITVNQIFKFIKINIIIIDITSRKSRGIRKHVQ